jgi:hypothetical protein
LVSTSKSTLETDIFPYGTKSLLATLINEKYSALIPKVQGENISSGFLHLEYFGRGGAGRGGAV